MVKKQRVRSKMGRGMCDTVCGLLVGASSCECNLLKNAM